MNDPGPTIRLLDPHTINQIAAGEVVERPSSVVKELVENAIDAGATRIEVELAQSGKELIRVSDDGRGMSPEGARTAFLRHATSKIRSSSDLSRVVSLGFRGEALPSIASVSRMCIETAQEDGLRYARESEGGEVLREESRPGPRGTEIRVEDLFFNTPARLKFLKSDGVELSQCVEVVSRYALAFPEIAFRLLHGGREMLMTSGSDELREAIGAVWGRDLARALVEVDSYADGVRLRGFAGPPEVSRPNRTLQWFFVNRRPVRSKLLTASLDQAYRALTPERRFAVAALHLDIPSERVDVNVSPTKSEVKFQSEGAVFDVLRRGVKAALLSTGLVPNANDLAAANWALATATNPVSTGPWQTSGDQSPLPLVETPAQAPTSLPNLLDGLRILGQIDATFIVAENATSLLIVDQHVAHERVLYERLREARMQGPLERQPLLAPEAITLDKRGVAVVQERLDELAAIGYELEPFGPDSFLVRTVPAATRSRSPLRTLRDLVDDLAGGLGQGCLSPAKEEILILAACKMAVKAGDPLANAEMLRLLEDLALTENPYFCPHGRPITIAMSKAEIARRFKR